jgi:hypothetical protein
MPLQMESVFAQIDAAIGRGFDLVQTSQYDDLSNHPEEVLLEVRSICAAAVERLAPPGSGYRTSAAVAIERHFPGTAIRELVGILRAIRDAYEHGYMQTLQELVHAELFADFLEMADELLTNGYKDPAAVIGGSVLEEHLRKLADKHRVDVDKPDGSPRKADTLNADLCKAGAYNKLEQKNVTAWLDLRNKAAHGHYSEYDRAHVESLVRDVRSFMGRYPA